jgi:hypothetical protein
MCRIISFKYLEIISLYSCSTNTFTGTDILTYYIFLNTFMIIIRIIKKFFYIFTLFLILISFYNFILIIRLLTSFSWMKIIIITIFMCLTLRNTWRSWNLIFLFVTIKIKNLQFYLRTCCFRYSQIIIWINPLMNFKISRIITHLTIIMS